MNDFYVILGAIVVFALVIVVKIIRSKIEVARIKKLHLKCPQCGEALVHEVFDIEVSGKDATIGRTRFSSAVKYYDVMTCPKCYYTVKMDDTATLNKLKEINKG